MRLQCDRRTDAGMPVAPPRARHTVSWCPRPPTRQPREPGMPSARRVGDAGPEGGPSTPTFLRRFGAVLVDWLLCQLIAVGLLGVDTAAGGAAAFAPLGVFAAREHPPRLA